MNVEQIVERAERAIQEKVFPGCVIGVVRQNGARTILPLGHLTYEKDSPSVQENTIYDLASITKSIPVASLAIAFAAEIPARFNLAEKVKTYIPELQNDYDATIEDLLCYRVKGPQLSSLKYKTFEEIRTHIFEQGFDDPVGESVYTNLPAFLLGVILERLSGQILPALANKYFFEPLEMSDTTFFPKNPSEQKIMIYHNSIAPTEIIDGDEIRGIVHDESARVFAKKRRAVGHAGLFSTTPDLLNFLEALINVGHGVSHMGAIVAGAQDGLGWEINREWMGERRSKKTFGKTGFTGTSVLCDIAKGVGLVVLSNRTYPHRPIDNSAINSFRADIADIVMK